MACSREVYTCLARKDHFLRPTPTGYWSHRGVTQLVTPSHRALIMMCDHEDSKTPKTSLDTWDSSSFGPVAPVCAMDLGSSSSYRSSHPCIFSAVRIRGSLVSIAWEETIKISYRYAWLPVVLCASVLICCMAPKGSTE